MSGMLDSCCVRFALFTVCIPVSLSWGYEWVDAFRSASENLTSVSNEWLDGFAPASANLTSVSANNSNLSSVCTHGCDHCTASNPWYNVDSFGRCADRTPREPSFFLLSYMCRLQDQRIRDENSCMHIIPRLEHEQPIIGHIYTTWNRTTGCHMNTKTAVLFGINQFHTEVCFGLFETDFALKTQGVALVAGVLLGLIGSACSRQLHSGGVNKLVDKYGQEVLFAPGAKTVAMRNVVGWCSQKTVFFYRFNQVIANVWLPMILMWVVSPVIVLPLWILLYWVPPFFIVGAELFSEPRHVVTPPLCSLHGIGNHQRNAGRDFLFSMLRPLILIGATVGIGCLIVFVGEQKGHTALELGTWVMNPIGFWRSGIQGKWGNIVMRVTILITVAGTILHMVLTIIPLARSMCGMGDKGFVKFSTDIPERQKVQALADKVCGAAVADEAPGDDKDRVANLKVETWSKFDVFTGLGLAFVDLLAYFYKIYVLLRGGRYPLAAVVTLTLVESMTTLVVNGHLRQAPKAITRAIVTGVPGVHFLAMIQWDSGLAGIPCLWLTVYALPLTAISDPVRCASSIFFLLTGTRALANYLQDVTDSDMYSLPDDWRPESLKEKELGQYASAEEDEHKGRPWWACCATQSARKHEQRTLLPPHPKN